MQNPFSLTFGKEPKSMIPRPAQANSILDGFLAENPDFQVGMITGLRGSGKTVLLTTVANELRQKSDWIVVDLSPERDLLHALAAELSNHKESLQIFKDAKINLSLFGFGLELDGIPPVTDDVVALSEMLEKLTQKGKRVLITIDEVRSSQFVREFVSQFQIFLRKNYNVFLLMTGLYENIYELQNEKSLTFLYRAPKIELEPLSIPMIALKYAEIFHLNQAEAVKMATVTKGYPFAFQLLGYLCYKNQTDYEQNLPEFDAYLSAYAYEKIWSELSPLDQTVMIGMIHAKSGKNEDIRRELDMDSSKFNLYRSRLMKKGLLRSPKYGYLEFVLPRFDVFTETMASIES